MRFEICIRDQKTRKHIKTTTVECESAENVLLALDNLRRPVLDDIFERLVRERKSRDMLLMTADSDFFDAKGRATATV